MIQILAIDDQHNVGREVCSLLSNSPDLDVICEVSSLEDALRQSEFFKPQVVVLSLDLPESSGIAAADTLRLAFPDAEILLLSNFDSWTTVHKALDMGVRGYVVAWDVAGELVGAVRAVSEHKTYLSTSLATAA